MNDVFLLIGSYADADQPGIRGFQFDQQTGQLTPAGTLVGIPNPSFLTVHPNRRWAYSVGETDRRHPTPGSVWAVQIDPQAAQFQVGNQQPSQGDWPCHAEIDAAGEWLLVTNYGSGNFSVLPVQANGQLGAPTDTVQHTGSGPNAQRQEGPHTHSSCFTRDGKFAIVADLGIDQLLLYRLDRSSGKLSLHSVAQAAPGAGPRHIACDASGRHVYVANELDSTVTLYDYDGEQGTLSERQTLSTLPAGAPENTCADIHIAPDGTRLYVSNRGHNSLAVYDIAADGRMTLVATPSCGGDCPRNFAISPNGRFALVANQRSDEVCVFPVSAGAQPLGDVVARVRMPAASCIQFV